MKIKARRVTNNFENSKKKLQAPGNEIALTMDAPKQIEHDEEIRLLRDALRQRGTELYSAPITRAGDAKYVAPKPALPPIMAPKQPAPPLTDAAADAIVPKKESFDEPFDIEQAITEFYNPFDAKNFEKKPKSTNEFDAFKFEKRLPKQVVNLIVIKKINRYGAPGVLEPKIIIRRCRVVSKCKRHSRRNPQAERKFVDVFIEYLRKYYAR